jgi:hypothetical protein
VKKLALNFGFGLALAVALLWFVQSKMLSAVATADQSGWELLAEAAASVPTWTLVAYALSFVVVHLLRTARWVLQVKPLGEPDLMKVFRVCMVGYAAIVLFPFRLGELVRPHLLARVSDRVTFSEAMGTAVVERIVDGLFITALLFVAVATAPLEVAPVVRRAGEVSLTVFASASFGLVLFAVKRSWAERLVDLTFGTLDRVLARVGKNTNIAGTLRGMIDGFLNGIRSLRDSGSLWTFLALTLAYWSVNAFGIWLLARGFGLEVSPLAGFGLLAVLVVGIMTPAAPGFVGTFQFFLNEGLKLYLPAVALGAVALAFALVMNVIQLVIQVGAAFPFFAGLNLRFADIFRLQEEASKRELEPG